MSEKNGYRTLLHAVRTIDFKCDRILGMLDVMRSEREDAVIDSIRESARDIYRCSVEERRRTGNFLEITRHED